MKPRHNKRKTHKRNEILALKIEIANLQNRVAVLESLQRLRDQMTKPRPWDNPPMRWPTYDAPRYWWQDPVTCRSMK